jgi:hypothetical protein
MTTQPDIRVRWRIRLMEATIGVLLMATLTASVCAHDIYSGLHGKDLQLCCGGSDCSTTVYRETAGRFEFLTREGHWIPIPEDRITFLPVPGENNSPRFGDAHFGHLCYRAILGNEGPAMKPNIFNGDGQQIYLYCAFIPPGSI